LSYRSSTEFGALAAELLADLERLRPGLSATASLEEIRRQCGERLRLRLPEIYREYLADATPADEAAQLQLYQRELEQLLVPRYAALAERQNQSERRGGPGGKSIEVYNRISYAVIFFVLGLFVIRAPFIPLWDKWIPFALAVIAPILSPWLPDLHKLLTQRRHAIALGILHMDLDQAERSLPLPPSAQLEATGSSRTLEQGQAQAQSQTGGQAAQASASAAGRKQ
jgi:hypothetical protein